MTKLLKQALHRVSQLSEEEQDRFSRFLLAELESERCWDDLFDRPESEDLLEHMADEALAAHRAGQTRPLDSEAK